MTNKRERWFMIILAVAGVAGFIYSIKLPLMGPAALSPGLFPGFVSLLMAVLGGIRLVQLFRSGQENDDSSDNEEAGKRNIFIITGIFLLYLLMLNYLHFIASTIIFLCMAMLFLYKKFYWKIPIISVVTALGVFYLFRYLLNVRLP